MGMDSWGHSRKSINDWSDKAGGFFLLPLLGCFSSCDLAFRLLRFSWAQFSTSCPTSKTTLRLAASASLHAPYCNAQLMSGYVTFFLFSARAVSQSLSNAAPCQVACHFWRKYSWEQQGRTGTVLFTSPCGLFQAGKLAPASVSRELYHAGSCPPAKCQLIHAASVTDLPAAWVIHCHLCTSGWESCLRSLV